MPVSFSVTELLFLLLTAVNNWDIILKIFQGKVQFQVVCLLLLRGGRHWIMRIIERAEPLMHCLRWGANRLEPRQPLLVLLLTHVLLMLFS